MSATNSREAFPEPEGPFTIPEPPRPTARDTPEPGDLTGPHVPTHDTHRKKFRERGHGLPSINTFVQDGRPTQCRDPRLPEVPGYEMTHEIARGGMGVVYGARDLALDREVAIKTLLPAFAEHPEMAAQFAREARITAHLPHPGIPPVHALGTLTDGRPFLAMKLIRGRTLAAILTARWQRPMSDSASDLDLTMPDSPGLLQAFEQVCLAVAFAHSQGIIHRDLKPLNVMVGAFGEVQVMDWGLAKYVQKTEREPSSGDTELDMPTPNLDDATFEGHAKGTPSYMPPEQAKGDWAAVDARADVFALGGILAVILTGEPPYTGSSVRAVLAHAVAADLGHIFRKLAQCGADDELVQLAKRCLSPDRNARPMDAAAVAGLVEAYRVGHEERARNAETERATATARAEEAALRMIAETAAKVAAEGRADEATRRAADEAAKAAEQRKRRRTQLVLAGVVWLLLLGSVSLLWWEDRQREQQRTAKAEFEAKQAKVETQAVAERARLELRAVTEKARRDRIDWETEQIAPPPRAKKRL